MEWKSGLNMTLPNIIGMTLFTYLIELDELELAELGLYRLASIASAGKDLTIEAVFGRRLE